MQHCELWEFVKHNDGKQSELISYTLQQLPLLLPPLLMQFSAESPRLVSLPQLYAGPELRYCSRLLPVELFSKLPADMRYWVYQAPDLLKPAN